VEKTCASGRWAESSMVGRYRTPKDGALGSPPIRMDAGGRRELQSVPHQAEPSSRLPRRRNSGASSIAHNRCTKPDNSGNHSEAGIVMVFPLSGLSSSADYTYFGLALPQLRPVLTKKLRAVLRESRRVQPAIHLG